MSQQKKCLKLVMRLNCVITEIDKEKRRVAISHRLTKENPFETFEKNILLIQLLKVK